MIQLTKIQLQLQLLARLAQTQTQELVAKSVQMLQHAQNVNQVHICLLITNVVHAVELMQPVPNVLIVNAKNASLAFT